jgi:hypothetical protein
MPLNYICSKRMEVSLYICITTYDVSLCLARRRKIYGISSTLNCTMIVLQTLYCFMQYKMKRKKYALHWGAIQLTGGKN